MATPAFVRQQKKERPAETTKVIKMGMISDEDGSDFETPAFLRKQAD
jgi:hypothetical protein